MQPVAIAGVDKRIEGAPFDLHKLPHHVEPAEDTNPSGSGALCDKRLHAPCRIDLVVSEQSRRVLQVHEDNIHGFLLLLKQIEALLDRIGDIVKIIAFPGRVGPDLPDRERGFLIDDICMRSYSSRASWPPIP